MEPLPRLIHLAKERDIEAISALYEHFQPGIFGYICGRVRDRATAEDLTSEVFLRMVEKIHRVKAIDTVSFAAWLFQVAHNIVVDHRRYQAPISLDSIHDLEYHCISEYNRFERQKYLSDAFNELNEEQRVAITGCIIMGYDAEAVGDIIGKSANAVRCMQHRALKSMKRVLNKRKDTHAIVS